MEENSLIVDAADSWQDWHVATLEWTPVGLEFSLDGHVVGPDTSNVSQASRHWTIQTAEHGDPAGSWVTGNPQIDWVALWEYTG